jgi:transcriptional regulator with XRE-family HTH domain
MKNAPFTPEYRTFCKILCLARSRAGMTQEETAKKLRRPQSYVSKYESRERRLDVIEFLRITTALSIDPGLVLNQIAHAHHKPQ